MMKRKIALVVRPPASAGRMGELRAAIDALRREGHRMSVRLTFESGDARRFARSAALSGCGLVIAAGGDGTINEVVNGLAQASRSVPLGLVPLGTANDLAASLNIPSDLEAALRLAVEGEPQPVDIARVNRRCFINVSTGGFGAAISQSAGRGAKKYLGGLAYVVRGAKDIVRFHEHSAVFRVDGAVVHDGEFVFFAVGNARQTGGGTPLTPLASTVDGRLDIMVLRGITRLQFISLLPQLRAGTHLRSSHVSYYRTDTFEIEPRGDLPVNADGEPVAGDSFTYDVVARPQMVVRGPAGSGR